MLPLVTGNTAGDPKRGLTQLLCSLSNLIGGIINLSQGMISCILTQSSLITYLFAEWALLVVRVVSLVKLTDRRQSKWNSARYGEKHYILRKRSQMCKDKWKNGGRQCHYRKKKICWGCNIQFLKLTWVDNIALHAVLTQVFIHVQKWGMIFREELPLALTGSVFTSPFVQCGISPATWPAC